MYIIILIVRGKRSCFFLRLIFRRLIQILTVFREKLEGLNSATLRRNSNSYDYFILFNQIRYSLEPKIDISIT